MIINETLNYNESVQFLLAMRKTVSTVVSSSNKLTEIQRVQLRSFILNEASDYEVMHLAMKGELPEEKFNVNEEFMLFSELKEKVLMNYDVISTILDEQDLSVFLAEVGPVYPTFTTAKPVLELYLAEADKEEDKAEQLSGPEQDEDEPYKDPIGKAVYKGSQKLKKAWDDLQKSSDESRAAFKAKFEKEKEDASSDTVSAFEKLKNKAGKFVKDTDEKVKAWKKGKDEELTGKDEAGRFKDTKAGSKEDHDAADAKVKRDELVDKAHEKVKKGVDYAKGKYEETKDKVIGKKDIETGERGKGAIDDAKEKAADVVAKTKQAVKDHAPEVQAKAKEAGEAIVKKGGEAVEKVRQVAKQPLKDTGDQIHQAASGAAGKVADFAQANQTALAATALAGVAAYGASKIYKRFFSQAARACSGKSGAQKTACMQQFKMKANQAKVQSLVRSKATCRKAKNPQKCAAAIDAQIQKAKSSAGK